MNSEALSQEKWPVPVRWIPFVLVVIASIYLGQIPEQSLAFAGLSRPLLNMCHLMFIMQAATVAYCIQDKAHDVIFIILGLLGGIWLHQSLGYQPGAKLLAGVSLLYFLLALWFPQRFMKFSGVATGIFATAHGIWMATDGMGSHTNPDYALFSVLIVLSAGSLAYAWGSSMRTLKSKSLSAYEGIEHLLVATVAGTALVYIYWGIFKQV